MWRASGDALGTPWAKCCFVLGLLVGGDARPGIQGLGRGLQVGLSRAEGQAGCSEGLLLFKRIVGLELQASHLKAPQSHPLHSSIFHPPAVPHEGPELLLVGRGKAGFFGSAGTRVIYEESSLGAGVLSDSVGDPLGLGVGFCTVFHSLGLCCHPAPPSSQATDGTWAGA